MSAWTPPHFDRYQFAARRPRVVSKSTGIAFSDLARMHVQHRQIVQERRLPTPKWAVRDEWLRELLIVYLEERFYVEQSHELPILTRLQIVRAAAERYAPIKRQLLKDWLTDYHTLSTRGLDAQEIPDDEAIQIFASLREMDGQLPLDADVARSYLTTKKLRDLEIQIQNVDTDLVLTERGHAEMIAAIVYLYYRLGWDSVEVAEQLQLKPPHIRQVLARLHAAWTKHLSQRFGRSAGDGEDAAANSTVKGLESDEPSPAPFDAIFEESV